MSAELGSGQGLPGMSKMEVPQGAEKVTAERQAGRPRAKPGQEPDGRRNNSVSTLGNPVNAEFGGQEHVTRADVARGESI